MCDTYSIKGHEVLEKKVSKHGTGGHLYLPEMSGKPAVWNWRPEGSP